MNFKHAVEHHVKEEEEHVFKKAKKILTPEEEKELPKEMAALKEKIEEKEDK